MTDWKALCAELAHEVQQYALDRDDEFPECLDRARAALAQPEPEDDVALLRAALKATAEQRRAEDDARAALAAKPVGEGSSDEYLNRVYQGAYQPAWERGEFHGAHYDGLRAVAAAVAADLLEQRHPAPPAGGESEVSDPVIPSRYRGHQIEAYRDGFHAGHRFAHARAADLLEQRHPTPVPVAWMYRGEPDFDGREWQERWRVTMSQQLAEYEAQLDKPIPLFRAQAAPVPVSEPTAELVEQWMRKAHDQPPGPDARVITALAARWGAAQVAQRHPAPVPVGERLPGPDDCLDEGWAWFFSPRVGWRQAVLPVSPAFTHWLPATALPLPAGEVE